ncbi:MAG: hypothetical protein JXQ80_00880 [Bacteroidales bacterium]|nr:hypothetical protein [Bacteroidales bacterium]
MALDWLSGIKDIAELITGLGKKIKSDKATKDLLLRELRINIKAFETAQKSEKIDYDRLLGLLKNDTIKQARKDRFSFNTVKSGHLTETDIRDERNNRYKGKDCGWVFKNIDEKIEDLQNQQQYHGSLNSVDKANIALQFSNLFYKMKLLADFIRD